MYNIFCIRKRELLTFTPSVSEWGAQTGAIGVYVKKGRMEEIMTEYGHLDILINEVNELRDKMEFREFDITKYVISYMPTKRTSYVGFKLGYSDYYIKMQKGIKETEKIRSTTKDYLKFIKNEQHELIQIESYRQGRLDCLFQVYWVDGVRYLFPYSSEGGFYSTYAFATKYEDDCVVEEYMVQGNQIVHETYNQNESGQIDYNYINYVSGGKYPVIEIRKGKFYLNPLTFVEMHTDTWLNH